MSATELLMLRSRLCRARTRSIRIAVHSRSLSQIRDMIRNIREIDCLVADVHLELAQCLSIWPR